MAGINDRQNRCGEETIFEIGLPDDGKDKATLSVIQVPPGNFLMGSPNGLPFAPEEPVHEVMISSGFAMSKYPITQLQYQVVTGKTPAYFADQSGAPVETVNWAEAKRFCELLSARLQKTVRLSSEAEWEYVCRAGTVTEYFFGDEKMSLPEYAWFDLNSDERTQSVGLKKANPWGFCEMIGNVWEWCEDVWHETYVGAPADAAPWLSNQDKQNRRVVRGGSWNMDAFRCRSSYRSFDWQDAATSRLGFRIVIEI